VSARPDLVRSTERGFYCAAGDFYIDPWQPVERAVLTHAHADHARPGSQRYLAAREGARLLRARLGDDLNLDLLEWGETRDIGGVRLSLHPAGHVLGSSQIRLESAGEVWVISGDYKLDPDPTCSPFEPLRADVFVTESTFGLPIYRWTAQPTLFSGMLDWWRENRDAGRTSVLFAYSLGKAQRVLAGLAALGELPGAICTHGAVERMTAEYRASGVALPPTTPVSALDSGGGAAPSVLAGALVIAPPSAAGSLWLRRFPQRSLAFASGWMTLRGTRRRRALDRGFALSDHADWPQLLAAIAATGATRVQVTHGFREPMVRYLREQGLDAVAVASAWEGESAAEESAAEEGTA
jgi:putative mRNA 3-end processing factor